MGAPLPDKTMKTFITSTLLLAAAASSACPCGCARTLLDTSLERSLGDTQWSVDLTHATINQDERDNDAHAHIAARHRLTTLAIEGEIDGVLWTLAIPRVERLLTVTSTGATTQHNGLGDLVLTARVPWNGLGIIGGVKMATGESDGNLGAVSRRYLQMGTGSTDLIVGVRAETQGENEGAAAFVQLTGQAAVASDDTFRPGTTLALTAGFRQPINSELALTLQGSVLRQYRDKNTQRLVDSAYREDLETSVLNVSVTPGIAWTPNKATSVHFHVTEPLMDKNYATRPQGGISNPIHSSRVVAVGVTRRF